MAIDIMGGVDVITTSILVILVLSLVGVIGFWLWQNSQYKMLVIIRQVIRGRSIVRTDKARTIKDKDGNTWIKLYKTKIRLPEPAPESIELTSKGKKFFELFELEDSGYFPSEGVKGYLCIKTKIDEKSFYNNTVKGMEPLTTQQRALYIHELKESESYKKLNKSELMMRALPYIAVVMIITVFLLFFNEAASPILEVGKDYQNAMGKFDLVIDKVDQLINSRQLLIDDQNLININNSEIPN